MVISSEKVGYQVMRVSAGLTWRMCLHEIHPCRKAPNVLGSFLFGVSIYVEQVWISFSPLVFVWLPLTDVEGVHGDRQDKDEGEGGGGHGL